jgi:hypothetical protein
MQVKYASVIELELGPFYRYVLLSLLIIHEEKVNDSKNDTGGGSSTIGLKRKTIMRRYKQSVGNRLNKLVDPLKGSCKVVSKAKRGTN